MTSGSMKRIKGWFVPVSLIALYWYSSVDVGISLKELFAGIPEMQNLISRMIPRWSIIQTYLPKMWPHLMETLRIALIGTTIGALLTIPIDFLAARNVTTNRPLFLAAKMFLNVVRTIPDLLLAAVFVAAVGIGPVAGVLALTIFSFGIIAKLTSETVESIDPGPLEALTAVGGNPIQRVWYAVVPQVLPHYIAYSLYVFEINVRVAAVLGLVGAGGIGEWLLRDFNLFRYRHAAVIILIIFAFVIIIDAISTKVRERLI